MAIYTPINLELWDEKQVGLFVKKKFHTISPQPSESAEYYVERIEKSSILKDMAKRAIHLSLMVKMLPTIIRENIKISRKRLYQEYIKLELKKAAFKDKMHPNLSTQDRLGLMRTISTEIFLQPKNSIDFENAKRVVRKELQNVNVNIDSLTRSLLNHTFLQRDGDTYHFAYQSIGEYLLALEVDNRLKKGDLNLLENIKLSATLAGMVLEIMGGLEAFPKMLSALELLKNKQLEMEKLSKIEFAALSIEDYVENIFLKWDETPNNESVTLIKGFIRYLIKEIRNNLTPIKIDIFLLRSPQKGKRRKKSILRLSDQWEKLLINIALLRKFHQNLIDQNFEFRIKRVNIGLMPFIDKINSSLPTGVVEMEGGELYCAGDEFVLGLIITLILKHIIDTRKYPPSKDALLKIGVSESEEKISIVFSYSGLIAEQSTEPKTNIEYIRDFLKLINGSISIDSETSPSNFEIFFPKG